MNRILLYSFLLASGFSMSQNDGMSRVRAELVDWDPVRGEWLAESFSAMASNRPIPDRSFPEDLTPAEMYSLIPQERRARISEFVQDPNFIRQQEVVSPRNPDNEGQPIRRPVGDSGNNSSVPNGPSANPYVIISRQSGCNLVSGRSYGDPHIRTYDGNTYSFQTVGEYVLSKSPMGHFEVQARQKPQSNEVSLNTAVAMNVYGDRVGLYASDFPDNITGTPVRVNGRAIYLQNETYYLANGGTIQNNGRDYVITWPTGEKVQARMATDGGMKLINLTVYVYECNGDYTGLLGNANGRRDDDFSGNNRNLLSSTIFQPFGNRDFSGATAAMEREHLAFIARDFGSQFLVNDQNTLFDYSFGRSSWSFYDPSFPRRHITLSDFSASDRERARRECERMGIFPDEMAGCVLDLVHVNLPPTPRMPAPDRTTGRVLDPVPPSERRPNVNRHDAYERPPSRSGSGGDDGGTTPVRTPNGNGTPPTNQESRPVTRPVSQDARERQVEEGTREGSNGVSTPERGTVTRPVGITNNEANSERVTDEGGTVPSSRPAPVRKPVESSNSNDNNSRGSSGTTSPSTAPISTPSRTNTPGNSTRPNQSSTPASARPSNTTASPARSTSTPVSSSSPSRTSSPASSGGSSSSRGSSTTASPSPSRR